MNTPCEFNAFCAGDRLPDQKTAKSPGQNFENIPPYEYDLLSLTPSAKGDRLPATTHLKQCHGGRSGIPRQACAPLALRVELPDCVQPERPVGMHPPRSTRPLSRDGFTPVIVSGGAEPPPMVFGGLLRPPAPGKASTSLVGPTRTLRRTTRTRRQFNGVPRPWPVYPGPKTEAAPASARQFNGIPRPVHPKGKGPRVNVQDTARCPLTRGPLKRKGPRVNVQDTVRCPLTRGPLGQFNVLSRTIFRCMLVAY